MKLSVFLIIPLCVFVVACSSNPSATTYSRDQTLAVQQVQFGTVLSVQNVNIEGTKSGVGTVAGGLIGGIAGSGVGHGRGSAIAAVIGGVAGGLIGDKVEQAATKKAGLELTVQLDSGNIISIVQEAEEVFQAGDHVRLLTRNGVARISH